MPSLATFLAKFFAKAMATQICGSKGNCGSAPDLVIGDEQYNSLNPFAWENRVLEILPSGSLENKVF